MDCLKPRHTVYGPGVMAEGLIPDQVILHVEYRNRPYHLNLTCTCTNTVQLPATCIILYQPMTHICVMSVRFFHKSIRIYMEVIILGANTLYSVFCFFKAFLPEQVWSGMVGKGLRLASLGGGPITEVEQCSIYSITKEECWKFTTSRHVREGGCLVRCINSLYAGCRISYM